MNKSKKIVIAIVVLVLVIFAGLALYRYNVLAKVPFFGKYLAYNKTIQVPAFDPNIKDVKTFVVRQGSGRAIKKGDVAYVFYAAALPNGQIFDTNQGKQPVGFLVGEGVLIAGLEKVLPGVREGTEIVVDVPANMAYGEKGVKIKGKEIVPPNTPLRFDILVVKVMSKEELKRLQEQMLKQAEALRKQQEKSKTDNNKDNKDNKKEDNNPKKDK